MAKGAYIGVDGVARKIKKGYVGVDGVARKIKKGYVGVGGVARPFWSAEGKLSYWGTADPLNAKTQLFAFADNGVYAVFAGGVDNSSARTEVTAYNSSLLKITPSVLSVGRRELAGASVGGYVLFCGGCYYKTGNPYYYDTVDAYDKTLTKVTVDALSVARNAPAGSGVGAYALIAGGQREDGTASKTVDAYNSDLVRTSATELGTGRTGLSGVGFSNRAIFAGGKYTDLTDVYCYDSNLVKTTASLSVGRGSMASAANESYAVFAGGSSRYPYETDYTYYSTVDALDSSLTRTTATALASEVTGAAAAGLGKFVLIGGGYVASTESRISRVETYDNDLVKSSATDLSVGRSQSVGATVGDYALFAGGYGPPAEGSSWYSDVVDVYALS